MKGMIESVSFGFRADFVEVINRSNLEIVRKNHTNILSRMTEDKGGQ